jgi:isoquinoline 1-oxidoreductase beta subunit
MGEIKLNRRGFLKVSFVSGTAMLVSMYLEGCSETPALSNQPDQGPTNVSPAQKTPTLQTNPDAMYEYNVFLRIHGTGKVTVVVNKVELGQGISTGLAMWAAEELDVPWEDVEIEIAYADRQFGNQDTAGSHSMTSSFDDYRRFGALAKNVLVAIAAEIWGISPEECTTNAGMVIHPDQELQMSYGQLVEYAANQEFLDGLDVSKKALLTKEEDFEIVSTPVKMFQAPQIVTGKAVYGMDIKLPDMVYATLSQPPVPNTSPQTIDTSQAMQVPGVEEVLETEFGVAVIARNTWAAFKGQQALQIEWSKSNKDEVSSESYEKEMLDKIAKNMANNPNLLQEIYKMPYLAHATMEPMNCTADVRSDSCLIWAPTQFPMSALRAAFRTGLSTSAIRVNIPLVGGGFGRRINVDYVEQAVTISQRIQKPVKLIWQRQDDIRHDFYHPMSFNLMSVDLRDVKLPSRRDYSVPRRSSCVETGAWRSASNLTPAYARECFIDEIAEKTGKDPLQLRLEIEPKLLHNVLRTVAEKSGWGETLPEGWGRGIACHATWNSTPAAHVVDVSVSESGEVTVHKVVCAIDCGYPVNPDSVKAQMEGGIIFGLTAALKGEIRIENGRVKQSNFNDYPILRMNEAPEIEVYILSELDNLQGVGEMALPPILPAVANAIYNATGVRVRHLPIRPEDLI